MRNAYALAGLVLLSLPAGCPNLDESSTLPASEVVLGQTITADASLGSTGNSNGSPSATAAFFDELSVSGRVTAAGDYRLFELGASNAGDAWRVDAIGAPSSSMVAVLFDANQNLLMRAYISRSGARFEHIMRESTGQTYLGIMGVAGGPGGSFRFAAARTAGGELPAPRRQLVYLNFGPASGVSVHGDPPISFPAFSGEMAGDRYLGQTEAIVGTIENIVRTHYAAYDVEILTSDLPMPSGEVSVIHFGGQSSGLLGLADNVDAYNQDYSQKAVVYVENFRPYQTMELSAEELGIMIGNVATHELGHLLGLYHTSSPEDVMDTTGTAWDLAGPQGFLRAPLDPSVFVTGMEDSHQLLLQTVGANPAPIGSKSRRKSIESGAKASFVRFARREAQVGCGTCRRMDAVPAD